MRRDKLCLQKLVPKPLPMESGPPDERLDEILSAVLLLSVDALIAIVIVLTKNCSTLVGGRVAQ